MLELIAMCAIVLRARLALQNSLQSTCKSEAAAVEVTDLEL